MEPRENRWRTLTITLFPMFIAALSLVTSIYNGYLNNRFVDLIENNVLRVEYMRTFKEIIDAYFQVKVKVGAASAMGEALRRGQAGPISEPLGGFATSPAGAAEAVARFGALGTYLANLRDEKTRERYTHLTWALETAMTDAPSTPPSGLAKLFEKPDQDFGVLNEDCVKSAKAQKL